MNNLIFFSLSTPSLPQNTSNTQNVSMAMDPRKILCITTAMNIDLLITKHPSAAASLYKIIKGQIDNIPAEDIVLLKERCLLDKFSDNRACYMVKEIIEMSYTFDEKSQTLMRQTAKE